ncbi:hypothetical protein LC048_17745 [Mesobacillus subterraneus]|uniref:hypothetical protein n=1 Tax=Mesobacillus subterraneus TaxID=285983 RepID=UPI001CFCE84F|nr:hypothetical protein [Mesobacillus subterraneus]WLR54271.1 hypothetical protein LC048_17745 [Mesobacillus subterraneus]
MKKAFKIIVGLFGGLFLLVVIALVVDISNDEPKEVVKESTQPVEKNEMNSENKQTWEEKVNEVAAKNATETEKFDEISLFANDYEATEDEIKDFEQFIIQEYKAGKYIMDISNHEYMLGNIFKSQVVEGYYPEGEPMKNFAFDFFQNSKYNYRKVENMTSGSTLANERQMDKALEEMGK